jgi:hypothetical protein
MSYAVTVVTPRGYPHSQAFFEVAETLHRGLLALGHDSVLTDQTCLPGRRHLVLGSNLLARVSAPLADDAVLYNLEQVEAGSPWLSPRLLELFRRHQVWDYSPRNVARLAELGVRGVRCVPIGYVPELTRIAPAPEDIDVLFVGSMNERRGGILRALEGCGVRVHAAFGVYGAKRDALVARAKIVLNLHFYEAKVFEVVRVSYLLANQRFVVSERGADPSDEAAFEGGVAFAAYDELVATCLDYLAKPAERSRIARVGFAQMVARPEAELLARAGVGRPLVRHPTREALSSLSR